MIDYIQIKTGAAVGANGAATATGQSPHIAGKILAVAVQYLDSPPAGTTVFTLWDSKDPKAENIINLVNAATDIKIYPRRVTEKNDGTDILYAAGEEVYEPYVVYGKLSAKIAGANADDSCTVTVWFER